MKDFRPLIIMYQDEARFGRISRVGACWSPINQRAVAPSHHMREYLYLYGAVSPHDGDSFFLILPNANTDNMTVFMAELSKQYQDYHVLLIGDNAPWHTAKKLKLPDNIHFAFIPPYTPEMNPIEQVWEEIRERDFTNRSFPTLTAVEKQLCETVINLEAGILQSITHRSWIKPFLESS